MFDRIIASDVASSGILYL